MTRLEMAIIAIAVRRRVGPVIRRILAEVLRRFGWEPRRRVRRRASLAPDAAFPYMRFRLRPWTRRLLVAGWIVGDVAGIHAALRLLA